MIDDGSVVGCHVPSNTEKLIRSNDDLPPIESTYSTITHCFAMMRKMRSEAPCFAADGEINKCSPDRPMLRRETLATISDIIGIGRSKSVSADASEELGRIGPSTVPFDIDQ